MAVAIAKFAVVRITEAVGCQDHRVLAADDQKHLPSRWPYRHIGNEPARDQLAEHIGIDRAETRPITAARASVDAEISASSAPFGAASEEVGPLEERPNRRVHQLMTVRCDGFHVARVDASVRAIEAAQSGESMSVLAVFFQRTPAA